MSDATYEQVLSQVKELSPSDRAKLLEYLDALLDSHQKAEEIRETDRMVKPEISEENKKDIP